MLFSKRKKFKFAAAKRAERTAIRGRSRGSLFSIIKKPQSKRFFQLRFEGLLPRGRNGIERTIKSYLKFLKSIFSYAIRKIKKFAISCVTVTVGIRDLAVNFKANLIRKLIWSRGRLGRRVANLIVMSIAFMVFLFGSVFNSSRFVNSQELDPDYLSNVTDIIPRRVVATTLVPEERKRAEYFVYVISEGETLSGVGNKFKISTAALKYVNGLTDFSVLKVGQEITIPPISGLIHIVEDGDTLDSIAEKYDVAPQAIADFNYILDTSSLAIGSELVVPDAKVPTPVVVIPAIPSRFAPGPTVDPFPSDSWCLWPTSVRIITQYFAWYHNGLDIATPWNISPPVFSCASGVVTRAGWDPWGLGLHVEVDHGNGYRTVYGHMGRVDVGYGQSVSRGQIIGLLGSTGRSTGPHLHFTVLYNGVAQNPLNYIR